MTTVMPARRASASQPGRTPEGPLGQPVARIDGELDVGDLDRARELFEGCGAPAKLGDVSQLKP